MTSMRGWNRLGAVDYSQVLWRTVCAPILLPTPFLSWEALSHGKGPRAT